MSRYDDTAREARKEHGGMTDNTFARVEIKTVDHDGEWQMRAYHNVPRIALLKLLGGVYVLQEAQEFPAPPGAPRMLLSKAKGRGEAAGR